MGVVRPKRSSPGARRAGALGWVALVLAGCQFDPAGQGARDGGFLPDANVLPGPDGEPGPDGAPVGDEPHLLLTEVKAEANAGEFIEVFNPTSTAVSLDDYYLSDDSLYATLPQLVRDDASISIRNRDAILKFPSGTSMAPNQVIVVAADEAGFRVTFGGRVPDFTVKPADEDPGAALMVVLAGSASSTLELTDSGEAVILFRWDGASDLVTDVDMIVVGTDPRDPGQDNGLPDKTGIAVDGPDADAIAQPYAPDMATMGAMSFRSGATGSYKRLRLEGDDELLAGGNGVEGHDETSENSAVTWEQTPSMPNPGFVPRLE